MDKEVEKCGSIETIEPNTSVLKSMAGIPGSNFNFTPKESNATTVQASPRMEDENVKGEVEETQIQMKQV